jgi:aspartyl protease family protein
MAINLLRPSWLAAASFGLIGIVAPGGGAVPRPLAPPAPALSQATTQRPPAALTARKGADGLFTVTALVNDVPVRFVVDTGANVVVLTAADARRAGVDPGAGSQRLQTAAGGTEMRWATLDAMDLAGRRLTRTRAAIVTDGLKMSLLGQNALARFESVTLTGDRLELR